MKPEEKLKAFLIIGASNSAKVSFNVPVKNNYLNVYDILIHECNAALIKDLINDGYSLAMTKKGLEVSKY